MKKWLMVPFSFLFCFLIPMLAFAAEDENPITKIKGEMEFNWGVLDNLGFAFSLIMIFVSLVVIAVLIFCVIRIIIFIFNVSRAKDSIKNKAFWIEVGAVILILFFIFSGAFLDLLENIYTWTSSQDLGGSDA